MSLNYHVIIPARYKSERLPGKLLLDLNGKTVIQRAYEQALKAKPASVIIATDNDELYQHAKSFGADVMMTSPEHQSGTDRIAEVVKARGFDKNALIVNVQGDEPFMPPELIAQVANTLNDANAPVATLCWPIEDSATRDNPNVVKVVRDQNDHALYFSRSVIPYNRANIETLEGLYRHIGLYAYRADFLLKFVNTPPCKLELKEALEQLRVLYMGEPIKVAQALTEPKQDINSIEDYKNAITLM